MNPTTEKMDNVKAMLENIQPKVITVDGGKIDHASILLVPVGMKAEGVKKYMDEYRTKPVRRSGTEKVDRLESFIALTNRFKAANSVIFAKGKIAENALAANLTAVLDYHPAGSDNESALNGTHRVYYDFPVSKEFKFWLENNTEIMQQAEFAILLEERISEMVVATDAEKAQMANLIPKFAEPLEILGLSRSLEIYSSETVQQAGKLSSGEREIKFSAVHNGADGKPISIPDFFMLNIPVFEGEAPVRMAVRLRYRKQGNGVVWFYDLYRVDRVFQTAFDMALEAVKKQTELPLFMGSAAS